VRIIALTKYGLRAASTRQRFGQYRSAFAAAGIELQICPLLGDDYIAALEQGRRFGYASIAQSYLRRVRGVVAARAFDAVWIQYEIFPYLPGSIELLAAATIGKPIVCDYDDAIFHNYDANASFFVRLLLEGKLQPLLRRATSITCGNNYLCEYAAQFCVDTHIVPTVVDTDVYRPVARSGTSPLVIGWIGSPSTWEGVRHFLPVLEELCRTGRARFRVVGAGTSAGRDKFPGMELVSWSAETEVVEVQSFDIGIMPLPEAPFQRGKCGYKLIQYMACGVPAVGSPIGINAVILQGGGGLAARTASEWADALDRLLSDAALRRRLGQSGRRFVVEQYSLSRYAPRLIALFQNVIAGAQCSRTRKQL
jgi:glycosyltransferase involved in cell wall biosynthesis